MTTQHAPTAPKIATTIKATFEVISNLWYLTKKVFFFMF